MNKTGMFSALVITLASLSGCTTGMNNLIGSDTSIGIQDKALVVIDVQNCFTKGGSLAVTGGNDIIPYINNLIDSKKYGKVILSQDWHPKGHLSFASNHEGKNVYDVIKLGGIDQTLWPDHCVQNTKSAEFHPSLNAEKADYVVQKGTLTKVDSYSAFKDNNGKHETPLNAYLKKQNIKELDIVGLALDYCVKATVIDAVNDGYKVNLHLKGTKAVNVNPKDGQNAIVEMKKLGVNVIE